MWQRKQTLYLLLAVILVVVTLSSHFFSWVLFVVLLFPAAVNVLTIFLFKQRPLQITLCAVALFLYLVWYVALIVFSKQEAPDASYFQLPWQAALPLGSILLTFLARKAVIADEKLVRDADRLRR